MSPLPILGLGLVLGLRHALDTDHVVAVTALTARARSLLAAMWLGVVWGLGHTLTLFAAGTAIIMFNVVVPARLTLSLELVVGFALVLVGALNLRRAPREPRASIDGGDGRTLRAFVVGLVHGLAGSAAVVLLVLAAIRDPYWASAYLLVFGLGTLLGMTLITTCLAVPVRIVTRRGEGIGRPFQLATGAASLVLGVWLVYRIGWVDGLFRSVGVRGTP